MNLQSIREAIATRIDSLTGVRASAFPPDGISTGQATLVAVAPGDPWIDFHEAFAKGLAVVRWTLSPYIAMVSDRAAFAELDALCSSGTGITRSLIDQIMGSDRTLGGVCADVVVDEAVNPQVLTVADGARYLTCDINLRVLVGRT